jgi:hypothetical protein
MLPLLLYLNTLNFADGHQKEPGTIDFDNLLMAEEARDRAQKLIRNTGYKGLVSCVYW